MKLFDSWKDFSEYMDFKGYFLDILIALFYFGIIFGGIFSGAYLYYIGKTGLMILSLIISAIFIVIILCIQKMFRKKYGKKFKIN